MGLVVGLGAVSSADSDAERRQAMEAILATGCTSLVREIVPGDLRTVLQAELHEGSTRYRVLVPEETAPLFAELDEIGETWVSCSYDEAERVGAHDVQDLAVVFDDGVTVREATAVIGGTKQRVVSLLRSQQNWAMETETCDLAWRLHRVARRFHLIIRSR